MFMAELPITTKCGSNPNAHQLKNKQMRYCHAAEHYQ